MNVDEPAVTLPRGWRLQYSPSTPSTQDLAREAGLRDAGSRLVFLTDFQSAGRGRSGRAWAAPPGSALLMTVLLREPSLQLYEHTECVSVALCEAVECLMSLNPAIKWPNDLLIGDRKVCGILAEATDAAPGYVAVGAGMNVSWGGARPTEIPAWATALDEHGAQPNRFRLLEETIRRLDHWLQDLTSPAAHDRLREDWQRRLWRLGQHVIVRLHDGSVHGLLAGTSPSGELRLRREDGQELAILNGELLVPGWERGSRRS